MNEDRIYEELKEKSKFVKKYGAVILIYLFVSGMAGFACFICEESMQTAMFGAFAYNNAKDYYGLQNHIVVMESTASLSKVIIYSIGWLNPLMFPSYVNYLKNNDAYIKASKSVVRNNI